MNSLVRRVLSLLLCICMMLSVMPVFAAEDETPSEEQLATDVVLAEAEEEEIEVSKEEAEEVSEEETEVVSEEEAEEVPEEEAEAAEPVTYSVAHYLWNWDLNDYVLLETEELTGMPGELTNAQEKAFEGCILETEIEQIEILEDGTTVAAVYYIELLEEAAPFADSGLYDTSVSSGYFKVMSEDVYDLAPGAQEYEIILNNAEGNDRKVAHVFAVDTKNEDIEVMPGYWAIDKLDPNNLPLDGVVDKAEYWKAEQLTKTVKYYEGMGYNVVGAMNTALAYDSNAPYGYMVWNGTVLGTPEIHKGAQTYLAIDWDGNVELRSMSTPLTGNEKTAIPANFGWLVKDGKLVKTSVERTSSDASRSMVGVKEDGTLIFCLVDGRNAPVSSGLSDYEMGEMMLALGCVNAFNGDGGGSSTFISKRAGETDNTMRSIPSDGSERATINSVILVSTAGATGIFDKVLFGTEYNYIAPGASMAFEVTGQDTKNFTMDIPEDVIYQVAEEGMGTIEDGVFTAGETTGTATIQAVYEGEVVGEKVLNVVHPAFFGFTAEETVLPYGKDMTLEVIASYGEDNWAVCVDGAYTVELSDDDAAVVEDGKLTATSDEAFTGVDVVAAYIPDTTKTSTLKVTFGKGSEILFDFEDGDVSDWMGFDEAKQWSLDNGVNNTLVGKEPLAGQYSGNVDGYTGLATVEDGQVRNGNYALAWSVDNTDADFAGWTYNVLFNVAEEVVVLRDVANGENATTLGMWLYIPEGATGLAFQSQLYVKNANGSYSCVQDHFMFTTVSGVRKNLNSCTEADIPESRWVYASIDISKYDYLCMPVATDESNSRSPSFVRTYIKPMVPAVHTFYIDDITLDYSSAVDDRVLPVITDVTYATQDTAIALAEGVVINGNAVTFSANVADNQALDANTGRILVDGIAVDTSVSGKVMSSAEVSLLSGVHTVTFEIEDKLGNLARVTRSFTIAGDAAFTLTGHNDSGEMPEYDSVYYVDLKAADLASLNGVTVTLGLQNANNWETEGLTVASGFEVTACSVDKYSNELTITIARTDAALGEDNTLVSIPVRIWSWDGIDHVTGVPIAPEDQYKTGYCPVVSVDCEVVYGEATYADGTAAAFGGKHTAATKVNDIVYPWHYHDAELTSLDQEATCSTAGYTGRTYCETCQSVIEWGTMQEATGHTYAVTGDQLACQCGEVLTGTGLVTVNDKIYFLIGDKLMTGWQNDKNKWCYADEITKEVKTGEFTVNKLTYTADEEGRLVSGAWAEDFIGRKYSYGPDFYTRCFQTIDGEEYYFAEYTGYALTGYHAITDNRNDPKAKVRWYHFDEDGKLLERLTMTGVLDTGDGLYYMEEGCVTFAGMVKVGDDYYCAADKTGVVLTGRQFVGSYIMDNSRNPMEKGYYEFGEDGKLLQGIVVKEDGTYYYEMGKTVEAGWVKDGDDYYVFSTDGKAMTGKNWVGSYLTQTSKDPYKSGNFIFDKDGKLTNGVAETEDGWYYCEAGVGKEAGLVCIDGQYYYADQGGKLASGRIWVGTYPSHGLLPKGYYEFGADGKMLEGVVEKADGTYYFEQGQPVDTGWLKVGEDYYVFTDGGKALTGYNWVGSYLTEKSRDPYMKGNFVFAEDGKLADGVAQTEEGSYYYKAGVAKEAGLVNVDGKYYLAEAGGKLATGYVWVGTYASNGLLPRGYYEFGADGAMLQGVVEKEDGLYYYEQGAAKYLGLIERDGEYYYVNTDGKLELGRVWVGSYPCNGLVEKGYYEFGADGAMLNGFEQLSDGLYYYDKGAAKYIGLKVIDSELYYIEEGGKVVTGYVWVGTYASNNLLPKGYYTFDDAGRFVE